MISLHTQNKCLIEKIPDVSNQEFDDIQAIRYKNQSQTTQICTEAKKKLSRLSSSAYGVRLENVNGFHQGEPENVNINIVSQENKENNEDVEIVAKKRAVPKKPKTRISCPPKFHLTKIEESALLENKLYPCLPYHLEEYLAPPTYSDSESQSQYSNNWSSSNIRPTVVAFAEPSAPRLSK